MKQKILIIILLLGGVIGYIVINLLQEPTYYTSENINKTYQPSSASTSNSTTNSNSSISSIQKEEEKEVQDNTVEESLSSGSKKEDVIQVNIVDDEIRKPYENALNKINSSPNKTITLDLSEKYNEAFADAFFPGVDVKITTTYSLVDNTSLQLKIKIKRSLQYYGEYRSFESIIIIIDDNLDALFDRVYDDVEKKYYERLDLDSKQQIETGFLFVMSLTHFSDFLLK